MTVAIDSDTLARLVAIADHPMGDGTTLETYLQYIDSNQIVNVAAYCDVLEMQLAMLSAATRFVEQRTARGESQAAILCGIGGSFGVIIGRLTMQQPVEGQEAASYLGQMIADRFSHFLAKWFAWRDSAPPKPPTHDIISIALN